MENEVQSNSVVGKCSPIKEKLSDIAIDISAIEVDTLTILEKIKSKLFWDENCQSPETGLWVPTVFDFERSLLSSRNEARDINQLATEILSRM